MKKAKILIVDDELTNIALIKSAVKDVDPDPDVAYDGESGLNLAREGEYDLILLDVMMPKLDGFKVCGLLKGDSRFKDVPVIILSSRAGDNDVEVSKQVGADEYLLKPVDQIVLSRTVYKVLGLEEKIYDFNKDTPNSILNPEKIDN